MREGKRQLRTDDLDWDDRTKPSVAIIGAGRLGTALGIALRTASYRIDLVAARNAAGARQAVLAIGGATDGLSSKQLKSSAARLGETDVILIATPDDVIAQVARELASSLPPNQTPGNQRRRRVRVVMHTSGALSSGVLAPLKRKGLATASFHPLVSISDPLTGAKWLGRAFFGLEGEAAAIRIAKRMVRHLGGQSFTIKAANKPLYHAAALMASPNMTALFDLALEMMNRCGLPLTQARRVLLPLVESTLQNLSKQSPAQALTGTFKRGDVATVRKHLEAIAARKLFEALDAYILLGRHSLSLTKSAPADVKEIEKLLLRATEQTRRGR